MQFIVIKSLYFIEFWFLASVMCGLNRRTSLSEAPADAFLLPCSLENEKQVYLKISRNLQQKCLNVKIAKIVQIATAFYKLTKDSKR